MIRVALCDDDININNTIKRYIETFNMNMDSEYEHELVYFRSSKELLEAPLNYDILLLDIMLEDDENSIPIDGIVVGRKLRQMGCKAVFVLVTSRTDRYEDGYTATVFRYLVKPITQQKFDKTMGEVFKHWYDENYVIPITFNKKSEYIKANDIIMIESYGRKRYICTFKGKHPIKNTWEEIESLLRHDKRFYQPQRGFLINFEHIDTNTKASVIMKNGEEIKFKRGTYAKFNRELMNYLGGDLWQKKAQKQSLTL